MIIFDGHTSAAKYADLLKTKVETLRQQGKSIKIAAVLYDEDAGSRLYSGLKKEASQLAGIAYQLHHVSLRDPVDKVIQLIEKLNQDHEITGIIIQKPARSTWEEEQHIDGDKKSIRQAFTQWWRLQTSRLDLHKDVDGLHPSLLDSLEAGKQYSPELILPATVRAVLSILQEAFQQDSIAEMLQAEHLKTKSTTILGKSDILGAPLFYVMKNAGWNVEMLGSQELSQRIEKGIALTDQEIIISATGRRHLITGEMVSENSTIIDVGEPQPDVEFETVKEKASFITPVPGGVGPMTVVSLLENAVQLVK